MKKCAKCKINKSKDKFGKRRAAEILQAMSTQKRQLALPKNQEEQEFVPSAKRHLG